jgi:hypothetical protein
MDNRLLVVIAGSMMLAGGLVQPARTPVARPETYRSAAIDANGNLAIVTADGLTVTIRKESGQTSFSTPVLSSSKMAVGTQAMFPNCCTSYDVPLQLIVYAAGKVHRFTGVNLPIFQWAFADGGTRVAYGQEPTHFGCATHYELRDIESERLIEAVDIPRPCAQIPNPKPVSIPPWVADLMSNTPN